MTTFYTEADGHPRSDLSHPRRFGNKWFNDPEDPVIQERVRLFGICEWRHTPDLAQLARDWRLPSGNAAAFALNAAIHNRGEQDEYADTVRTLNFYTVPVERCNDQRFYLPPADAPPCSCLEHDCEECYPDGPPPCDCDERHCEECYPDGPPPCDCDERHCEECHPEGPVAAGCSCRDCRNVRDRGCATGHDDQDDDDDWAGLPDIPDVPEGRCRFGIEIEFNEGSRYDIATHLLNRGIPCRERDYTHEIVRYWKMTTDSSVTGGELVSPILAGDDASIELTRECIRIVKQHGGYTGRNVGMHVHLDVTSFERDQLETLALNLQRVEKPMAAFVPKHRYGSNDDGYANPHGARLLAPSTWNEILNWIVGVDPSVAARNRRQEYCPAPRYSSFNFQSLLTYGTVECRLLGHTLNTIKVRTWIRTLQTIIWASSQLERIAEGDDFRTWLVNNGLEPEHADHFIAVVESRGNSDMLAIAA